MNIVDIHTHMLAFVDDGARNKEIMREMLERSFCQGVKKIIFTPHYNESNGMVKSAQYYTALGKETAKSISDELEVFEGNEIFYTSNSIKNLIDKKISTLAGSRYILVEFPYYIEHSELVNSVNELIISGYIPIIAHVERYRCLYEHPEDIKKMVHMGAYLQLNAGSIIAGNLQTKRFCKRLLRTNLISFIASDCHNLTDRAPNLEECIKVIKKKYGEAVAELLFWHNPNKVLQNEIIVVP